MTRQEGILPEAPPPSKWGPDAAEAYIDAHLGRYTREVLEAALVAAGHDAGSVSEAIRRVASRREAEPTRATARRIVTIAYVLTFLLLAVVLLAAEAQYGAGYGVIATGILAVTLGLAFAISRFWVGRLGTGALWAMLSLPLILLAVVGGACYATTGFRPGLV